MVSCSRIFPTVDTHKYFKFFKQQKPPRYYNLLFDAWEHQYGDCRAAAIDRLETLCQAKYHLRVPATVAARLDISMLKAPTPKEDEEDKAKEEEEEKAKKAAEELISSATASSEAAPDSNSNSSSSSSSKRLGVVSKPLHVKPNHGVMSGGSRKVASGASSAASSRNNSRCSSVAPAAEPMSTSSSSSSSEGNKSRSPSPESKELDNTLLFGIKFVARERV